MDNILSSTERLWDNFTKRMKRNPQKTLFLVLLIVGGAILYKFSANIGDKIYSYFFPSPMSAVQPLSNVASSTTYAPQKSNNSPGAIQVQGSGNTIITNPEPEPKIVSYGIKKDSSLQANGEYYTKIDLTISHFRSGNIIIDPKAEIACVRQEHYIDPTYARNDHIELDCLSKIPLKENQSYFSYKVN